MCASLEAEHALNHPDAVLDLRTHSGLVAILRLDRLINSLSPSVAPVDAVASPRSEGLDNVAVALVGLISPDAGLLSAQQVGQPKAVGVPRPRWRLLLIIVFIAIIPIITSL